MSVYSWSAHNRFKLMSCVADFRLNIQPTDLMERYETFLWTQTIQIFQLITEWMSIFLKSIDMVSEIKIKQSVSYRWDPTQNPYTVIWLRSLQAH
jgi:hypothetical protein